MPPSLPRRRSTKRPKRPKRQKRLRLGRALKRLFRRPRKPLPLRRRAAQVLVTALLAAAFAAQAVAALLPDIPLLLAATAASVAGEGVLYRWQRPMMSVFAKSHADITVRHVLRDLLLVAGLRMLARACGVGEIVLQGTNIRFAPVELRESQELRVKRLYPGTVIKPAVHQVLVPRPKTAKVGGKPLVGRELLGWVGEFLTSILGS